jgi:hypothetical protein
MQKQAIHKGGIASLQESAEMPKRLLPVGDITWIENSMMEFGENSQKSQAQGVSWVKCSQSGMMDGG